MIKYLQFKEIFNKLDINREPEIEIYFKNRKYTYMIIKYNGFITFQRCGTKEEQSGEIKFSTLDELYNSTTIDDINLKREWENIEDILFDCTFSIIDDKEYILKLYGVQL